MSTAAPTVACIIVAIANGEVAEWEYSSHYGVFVTFTASGDMVSEESIDWLVSPGDTGQISHDVRRVRVCASRLEALLKVVPEGNLRDMGGPRGLAEALWVTASAEAYAR